MGNDGFLNSVRIFGSFQLDLDHREPRQGNVGEEEFEDEIRAARVADLQAGIVLSANV